MTSDIGKRLGTRAATGAFARRNRRRCRSTLLGAAADNRHDAERLDALNAWLVKAGLRGEPDHALVSGFCERAVAAGLPIGRAQTFIDSLHPLYEGRLVRWGHDASQPVVQEYGRTGMPAGVSELHPSGGEQPEACRRWRESPFFRMLQTGETLLRRRLTPEGEPEFPALRDYRAAGLTEYVAII